MQDIFLRKAPETAHPESVFRNGSPAKNLINAAHNNYPRFIENAGFVQKPKVSGDSGKLRFPALAAGIQGRHDSKLQKLSSKR